MKTQNHHHIEAPLEAPDTSVRHASYEHVVACLTEVVTDERMVSPAWVSDAQGDFAQPEYDAITAAIIAGDAMKVGMLTIAATRGSLRDLAEKEAESRVKALGREDLRDWIEEGKEVTR